MANHDTASVDQGQSAPDAAVGLAVDAAKAAQAAAEKAAQRVDDLTAAREAAGFIEEWSSTIQTGAIAFILVFLCCLLLVNIHTFYRLFQNISGVEAGGVKITFAEKKALQAAVDEIPASERLVSTVSQRLKQVVITKDDRDRALKRAVLNKSLLEDLSILWVDDVPTNNHNEKTLFTDAFAMRVASVESEAQALGYLNGNHVDIILSDIARGDSDAGKTAGLKLPLILAEEERLVPVIFYVTRIAQDLGTPPSSFGITNRPDELLHLILDAAERSRSLV